MTRQPRSADDCESRLMCDECEEIEPLTVAYYGKAERKGWRPPASAKTEPIHDDRLLSGRPYAIGYASMAPRFVCEAQGSREVD
ncbi:MAG TPA: hypothetical protein VGG01_17120 [Xanthobacteraceae bacterium]|jgi:hypothetical protein